MIVPYEPRFYRQWPETPGLVSFDVAVAETDLHVRAERNLERVVLKLVHRFRSEIEAYAEAEPEFFRSLDPLPCPLKCPEIVRRMLRAGSEYGVGPMAAVAGALAEAVGRELLKRSAQCMIENGGDLFVKLHRPARLGLYAGLDSPFTRRLNLVVECAGEGIGVCASSGRVGHSFSLGKADAVVAMARDTALADAAATAICNRVQDPSDIARVIEEERARGKLLGLAVAMRQRMGVFGAVELAT